MADGDQVKKPDYTDTDWSWLIRERHGKWALMWEELEREGIFRTYLWDDPKDVPDFDPAFDQPVPSLAIWPIQPDLRGIIIVCAGGGFFFKSFNEARPVAAALHQAGLNAAVLDYRFTPYNRESARDDGLRAIRYLRCHADRLGIDANHIAIGGFSAGGILTSMVINGFTMGDPTAADPVEQMSSRPDAAFQMYGSFRAMPSLTVEKPSHPLMFSFEEQQEKARQDFIHNLPLNAPPMFMAQTDGDDPHHVLHMALAYADRGIPHEYHLFHGGPHGGGLYNGADDTPDFPHTAHWIELATEWFKLMGF